MDKIDKSAQLPMEPDAGQEVPVKLETAESGAVDIPDRWTLQMFGVKMEVPGTWILYPESRSTEFRYEEGFLKFERRGDRINGKIKGSVSLGLRWQRLEEDMTNEQFMERYVERLLTPSKKSRKKTAAPPVRIVSREQIMLDGQCALLLECSYTASAKLFGPGGTQVCVLNVAFFDEPSRRTIVGTALAEPDTIAGYRDMLVEALSSIRCS